MESVSRRPFEKMIKFREKIIGVSLLKKEKRSIKGIILRNLKTEAKKMINYITENKAKIDRSRLRKAEEVVINPNLPKEQRIKNYIEQIGNPYCYLDGDGVVSLSFAQSGAKLEEKLKSLAANFD